MYRCDWMCKEKELGFKLTMNSVGASIVTEKWTSEVGRINQNAAFQADHSGSIVLSPERMLLREMLTTLGCVKGVHLDNRRNWSHPTWWRFQGTESALIWEATSCGFIVLKAQEWCFWSSLSHYLTLHT